MTPPEIAAYVQGHLARRGIDVVLSGGAAVALYSRNAYISRDVDLVNAFSAREAALQAALEEIGFVREGRHFKHPLSELIVEFPPGPLAAGAEPLREVREHQTETGPLRVISPTDCVKDRLASYYHWGDRQALEQALLVAQHQAINLEEIARWSRAEGKAREFRAIRPSLLHAQEH